MTKRCRIALKSGCSRTRLLCDPSAEAEFGAHRGLGEHVGRKVLQQAGARHIEPLSQPNSGLGIGHAAAEIRLVFRPNFQ